MADKSARALGFKKGDFAVSTTGAIELVVIIGAVSSAKPLVEKWGLTHSITKYDISSLRKITREEFISLLPVEYLFEEGARSPVAREAIKYSPGEGESLL